MVRFIFGFFCLWLVGCGQQSPSKPVQLISQEDRIIDRQLMIDDIAKLQNETDRSALAVAQIFVRDKRFGTDLKTISRFSNVEVLDFTNIPIGNSSASKQLQAFKNLTRLAIRNTNLGKGFFANFNLTGLEAAYFSNCSLQDDNINWISRHKQLSVLDLSRNAKLSDDVFLEVRHLENLKELYLDGTAVTGIGISHIQNLELQCLSLSESLKPEFLPSINMIESLQILDLSSNNKLDSNSLKHISGHPELFELNIGDTVVDVNVLKTLFQLPSLRRLHIYRTKILESDLLENIDELASFSFIDVSGLGISENSCRLLKKRGIEVCNRDE